jgi:hypothetical protein
MRLPTSLAALFLGLALPCALEAQVGRPLPDASRVKDFEQTEARSFDDLIGRTVLVEFFAYW